MRDRDLPFKLTGGLHHVVAHTESTGGDCFEEQHGLPNVLVATHHLERGATPQEGAAILELRDADVLASIMRDLDENSVKVLRARFRSFGCCGVMDPVNELIELGLLASSAKKGANT